MLATNGSVRFCFGRSGQGLAPSGTQGRGASAGRRAAGGGSGSDGAARRTGLGAVALGGVAPGAGRGAGPGRQGGLGADGGAEPGAGADGGGGPRQRVDARADDVRQPQMMPRRQPGRPRQRRRFHRPTQGPLSPHAPGQPPLRRPAGRCATGDHPAKLSGSGRTSGHPPATTTVPRVLSEPLRR